MESYPYSYEAVAFISQRAAEQLDDPARGEERICVSCTSPYAMRGCRAADLRPGSYKDVLRLQFHDADAHDKLKDVDQGDLVLFGADHAHQVLTFLRQHEKSSVKHIVVHCEAGISRSAGIAKFISEIYYLPFLESYSLYNRRVYSTLIKAYYATPDKASLPAHENF